MTILAKNTLTETRARALRSLIPPPRLQLSEWIEREIVLPEGVSALPGAVRLWSYQRDIADAITDPACEWVTLLKPTRVGEALRLCLAARRRTGHGRLSGRRWCVLRAAGVLGSTPTQRPDIRPFLGQPPRPKVASK